MMAFEAEAEAETVEGRYLAVEVDSCTKHQSSQDRFGLFEHLLGCQIAEVPGLLVVLLVLLR